MIRYEASIDADAPNQSLTADLFTLPDTDSDTDLGTDIHTKNGYSSALGSESGSESKHKSVHCEHALHSTM